jgi:hypothetical protein
MQPERISNKPGAVSPVITDEDIDCEECDEERTVSMRLCEQDATWYIDSCLVPKLRQLTCHIKEDS